MKTHTMTRNPNLAAPETGTVRERLGQNDAWSNASTMNQITTEKDHMSNPKSAMTRFNLFRAVSMMMLVVGLATAQAATTWDAYSGFHAGTSNPDYSNDASQLWQYGYQTQGVYGYDQYSTTGAASVGYQNYNGWGAAGSYYGSGNVVGWQGDADHFFGVDPDAGGLRCGLANTSDSWIAWKSPITGTVDVSFSVSNLVTPVGYDGIEYWLQKYGVPALRHARVSEGGTSGIITVSNVAMTSGEMLYLAIGPGPAQSGPNDYTGVTFSITESPVPEPATMALLALGGLLVLRRHRKG